MPTWLIGAIRTGIQAGWIYAVAFLAERGFELPAAAPAWLDEFLMGAALAAFVMIVQWLETRSDTTPLGKLARRIAAAVMLGARRPLYPERFTPAASLDEARVRRPDLHSY
jgi:hypothetical protein